MPILSPKTNLLIEKKKESTDFFIESTASGELIHNLSALACTLQHSLNYLAQK
jgi:hypothetical protein